MTGDLTPNYPSLDSLDSNITNQIGNTPLLELRNIWSHPTIKVYAKAEWTNLGGSVKARPAFNMIQKGIKEGKLTKDKIIFDSTSGNTGIAYAVIGAALGYKVTLVVPENVTEKRKEMMRRYNAEIIFSSPMEGSDGATRLAEKILAENPEKYFFPDQYGNDANWQAHASTAEEVFAQTNGKITHFAAGMGTSGTVMGTGRFLKEKNSEIQIYSVQPDSSFHGLEGMKHMETTIVPAIYNKSELDGQIDISTEDAYDMVDLLKSKEGLEVGFSSGANVCAALKLAQEAAKTTPNKEASIVTILADSKACYDS